MIQAGFITWEHTRQSFWSGLFFLSARRCEAMSALLTVGISTFTLHYMQDFPLSMKLMIRGTSIWSHISIHCTYNMKLVLCTESIPRVQWVRVNPRTHGPTQDLSQCPWSRTLTGESAYSMCACFDDGGNQITQRKPTQARGGPAPAGFEPRTFLPQGTHHTSKELNQPHQV